MSNPMPKAKGTNFYVAQAERLKTRQIDCIHLLKGKQQAQFQLSSPELGSDNTLICPLLLA